MPNNAQDLFDIYNAGVLANVTTQTDPNSIDPVAVGNIGSDLEVFVPMWGSINLEEISPLVPSAAAPSALAGSDGDRYYQQVVGGSMEWRKEGGVWVQKALIGGGGDTYEDGIKTGLNAFLSGGVVTIAKGTWAIGNILYSKATQTQFTLTAADALATREDLFYANTSNQVLRLEGTPGGGEPALPANTIKIDVAVVPSVASGNAPYLQSSGVPLEGMFVQVLGVISDPDLVTINATFQLDSANAANPFIGSGCSVDSRFQIDGVYGYQEATGNDTPIRTCKRVCTNGVWSVWNLPVTAMSDGAGEYDASTLPIPEFANITIYDAAGNTSPATYNNTTKMITGLNYSESFTFRYST